MGSIRCGNSDISRLGERGRRRPFERERAKLIGSSSLRRLEFQRQALTQDVFRPYRDNERAHARQAPDLHGAEFAAMRDVKGHSQIDLLAAAFAFEPAEQPVEGQVSTQRLKITW